MPPKNSTPLDPSKIYLAREGEAPIPLDGIQEVTLEPAEGGVVEPAIAFKAMMGEMSKPIDLNVTIDFAPLTTTLRAITKAWDAVVKTVKPILECKNRRLLHLAAHGKPRVRKKNIKRILRGD